ERGIEISVELIATGATVKDRLRTTIVTGLVPALGAGLRGMPGVNLDHTDTTCLGLVLNKRVQLGKAPTMQTPFVIALLTIFLATPRLGGVPDVLEIFKDDGSPWGRSEEHTSELQSRV